jgi:retron-type reverse transcriptase
MERVVARENMLAALRRVEKNKGAAGVDGLKIADLRPYLRDKWAGIRGQLLGDSYRPMPVRRV